jgi:hypothetical protein
MLPAKPLEKTFAEGYPSAVDELRAQIATVEPDLVVGLYALLRAAGMTVSYSEAEVLSGQATQFVYRCDQPASQQISFVPPVDTLFKALEVTWKEVTPSDVQTAYGILREWIEAGSVAMAKFEEPLLIYGFAHSELESALIGARLPARLSEIVLSPAECEKDMWRYPIDEGNLLIRVERAPRKIPDLTELVKVVARRAVHAWYDSPLAGCATGDQAYRDLARDLRDEKVDFTQPRLITWTGRGLWKQWTARIHAERFFDRTAPRFGGKQRTAVSHAAFCYGQCVDAWKKWAGMLGPTWNAARIGFLPPFPDLFLAQWRDMHRRSRAAEFVEQARDWEEKAVMELVKLI